MAIVKKKGAAAAATTAAATTAAAPTAASPLLRSGGRGAGGAAAIHIVEAENKTSLTVSKDAVERAADEAAGLKAKADALLATAKRKSKPWIEANFNQFFPSFVVDLVARYDKTAIVKFMGYINEGLFDKAALVMPAANVLLGYLIGRAKATDCAERAGACLVGFFSCSKRDTVEGAMDKPTIARELYSMMTKLEESKAALGQVAQQQKYLSSMAFTQLAFYEVVGALQTWAPAAAAVLPGAITPLAILGVSHLVAQQFAKCANADEAIDAVMSEIESFMETNSLGMYAVQEAEGSYLEFNKKPGHLLRLFIAVDEVYPFTLNA